MSSSEQNPTRHAALDDYDDDSTLSVLDNLNINEAYDSLFPNEDDDDFSSDVEVELNTQDEAVYSDDVQNAFSNYENEYSQYWNQADPTWNHFSSDEQNEMFEQMRECMLFMSQEYTTAEMPNNLVERVQESELNPEAVEFQPSWLPASTTSDNEPIVVTSWTPCAAKKQEDD